MQSLLGQEGKMELVRGWLFVRVGEEDSAEAAVKSLEWKTWTLGNKYSVKINIVMQHGGFTRIDSH